MDRARSWTPPLIALSVAVLVRAPRYDIAWFGVDQVFFMVQARRVLAADWDVTGPLASGLNIVGPLYSYLLAALLWIREDPAFPANVTMWIGVLATLFVFDAARRMTSTQPALIAALSYAVAPALVEGTRLVWNPSLLPPMLALGWWTVVRYAQHPSIGRVAACGLVAGLLIPLHITGVFGAIGLATAAVLCVRPRLTYALVAMAAALVPLAPGLVRLTQAAVDAAALGQRLGNSDWASTFEAIAITALQFPVRVWQDERPWAVWGSVISLHWQAAAAMAGVALGIWRGPFRGVWFGMALSLLLHIIGTRLYGGTLDWYYFLAVIPPLCLLLAPVASAMRPGAMARVALTLWAVGIAAQVSFIYQFDTRAIERGLITVDESRLGVRLPRVIAHSIPLRELCTIGGGLRRFIRDGATALAAAHGGRGELWRETGAEFMPPATGPDPATAWQFVMMGPGVKPIRGDARVLPGRVCASIAPTIEWRMHHPPVVVGWERTDFDDRSWRVVPVPRRVARSSPGGFAPISQWREPQIMARGRLGVRMPRSPHLVGVTVRGGHLPGRSLQAFVNGRSVQAMQRTVNSSIVSTDEWLLDVTDAITNGLNTIALLVDAVTHDFDFDVFDVPCVDDEWYQPISRYRQRLSLASHEPVATARARKVLNGDLWEVHDSLQMGLGADFEDAVYRRTE